MRWIISRSCVATTTVVPRAFTSWNSAHDLLGHLRVEVAGRLVGQQQHRLVDEGARDGHALLLAARQLQRVGVHLVV